MTVHGNKNRGEVPFPMAGEGAFLRFTVDGLEQLETKYGEDYITTILKGFSNAQIKVYKACVAVAGNNMTVPFPFGKPLEEIMYPLRDALFLTLYGRNFEEQQAVEDELFKKQIEKAQENPRMAAALYSKMSDDTDTEQD